MCWTAHTYAYDHACGAGAGGAGVHAASQTALLTAAPGVSSTACVHSHPSVHRNADVGAGGAVDAGGVHSPSSAQSTLVTVWPLTMSPTQSARLTLFAATEYYNS